jgi:hypothetical protein
MQEDLREKFRRRLIICLVCIPILQALWLPWMPGLDWDKARGGTAAYKIIHGDTVSFTESSGELYGGILRLYVEILVFLIGGANRLTLELCFAIYNSLTILFVFLAMRRLFGATAGLWSALVFSVSPWLMFRDIDNFFSTVIAAYLYCFSFGTPIAYFLGGIVLGLGCYENQRAAVIVLAAFGSWLVFGKRDQTGIRGVFLTGVGCAIGFSPRLIYSMSSGTQIYMEPFNNLLLALGAARKCVPYFLGMVNGSAIYLKNVGYNAYPVMPFNSIVFIGSSVLLVALWKQRLYRALLLFTLFMYLLPFAVIKYTAVRYFQFGLFGATLIAGLGIHALSRYYKKTAAALLAVYCGVNIFYLCANFFIPFALTGGICRFFKLGTLTEVSHHLVRTDVLYECLDKDVPVIVCPDLFIARSLQFYDVEQKHFKAMTRSIRDEYDDFYFIDYTPSEMGIKVEPHKFPQYLVTRECVGLKNFVVYRFRKRWGGYN